MKNIFPNDVGDILLFFSAIITSMILLAGVLRVPPSIISLIGMLFLFSAIAVRRIRKEKGYSFVVVVILFFVQAFFIFTPKTPIPLILIIVFSIFYKIFKFENPMVK